MVRPFAYAYLTDVDYTTYSYVYSFDGECAITPAIDYVISDELPKLYSLEGHGEAELPAEFQTQIEKENMELESFSLLNTDEIPEDADALLIYAPESDISAEEAELLEDYLENGGKLLVIAGPTEDGTLTNLYSVLESYGVEAADRLVVDTDREHYAFQQPYILLPDIQSGDITDPLIEAKYYAIFPLAQGLTITGSSATALLTTSDEAFSKAAGFQLDTYEKEDGDTDGPFSVAVSVDTGNDGQLIWFASSYFLDEMYNAYSSGANLDLAMNALSSLIGEREAVSIRSKSLSYNYLTISESAASMLKTWMIGVIPGAFVLYGVFTITYDEDGTSICADDVYFTDGKPLDTAVITEWLTALHELDLTNYVIYNVTDEELAAFGLDEPALTVTLDYSSSDEDENETDTGTLVLHLSQNPEELAAYNKAIENDADEIPDVTCYARVGDSQIVYSITQTEFDKLTAVSYDTLRHQKLFTADFDTVTSVDVTLEGETYTFTYTPPEDEDDEDAEGTWTYDNEKFDVYDLRTALRSLTAVSFTDEAPAGQEEISLVIHLDNEAFPTFTLTLYRYDGENCLAAVDGEPAAFVSRAQTVDLVEAVRARTLGA